MAGQPIAQYGTPNIITDAATQVFDCIAGSYFIWTLGAARTMTAPVNPVGGQFVLLEVVQDGTGSRLVTWPSTFIWPGVNNSAPVLQTQASTRDRFLLVYDATALVWRATIFGTRVVPASKFVTQAAAGPTTQASGDITGAANVFYQTTNGAPGTVTTRTATQLFADDPDAYIGKAWVVTANNTGAGTLTLAGGVGVTITGTATVAQNVTRTYSCIFNSATTMTMQIVSVGSVS